MGLAKHLDGYRRVWMFPRNIRRISPWKMSQILSLMMQLTRDTEWAGNQDLQDAFCKALEVAGLKKEGVQYDAHSGGPRTYLAQLKCLGLLFEREGRLLATKAGEDLANGLPPLPIVQSMVLRHQYPSVYGNLANVRMNPQMRVKPFLFVLKLLNHHRVRHLTNEELAVPVVFGHTNDCFNLCIRKILALREGTSFVDILEDRRTDLYLPRSTGRSPIPNIMDIANTCKNYLQATCMISTQKVDGREIIQFSEEMKAIYEEALKLEERFIPVSSREEPFQRAYGAWDRVKDTRSIVEPVSRIVSAEEGIILSQFYRLCGEQIISEVPEEFVEQMHKDFGFAKTLILDSILPHLSNSLDFFESTFLELSKGGASKAIDFEKSVCSIFSDKLHFKARHTGQLRRPHGVGGFSDVFAVALDDIHCGIIDAKASSSYNLPASDYHQMLANYIPNYTELTGGRDLDLEFCMYVAGGFAGDVNAKLRSLKKEATVGCSAIRAVDLLFLAKKGPSRAQQEAVRTIFKQGDILDRSKFLRL